MSKRCNATIWRFTYTITDPVAILSAMLAEVAEIPLIGTRIKALSGLR